MPRARPAEQRPSRRVVTVEKNGQREKKTAFYVRIANATREIAAAEERRKYIAARWGRTAPSDQTGAT